MTALCVCIALLLALVALAVYTDIAQKAVLREGYAGAGEDPGGPSPLKLAQTNANNVKYLQNKVEKLQQLKNFVEDVSGQAHKNLESLKEVSRRVQSSNNNALGGPPKKPLPHPISAQ
jgi:hypothetical protein